MGPFATVAEALEQIDRENLSAAILDVQLADQTSLAVARRLAEKRIPFLFYTAYADRIDQLLAVQIVKKPAMPGVLVNSLAALISETPVQL